VQLKIGKLPHDLLQSLVLSRVGARRPEIVVGPAVGEDAAVVRVSDGYLVVHTDPISGSVRLLGYLAVHVPSNDVAVRGVEPAWLSVAIFLPRGSGTALVDEITRQIDEAARELGVAVAGGHTEVTTAVARPLAVVTAMGLGRRFVTTSGARPGDLVIMTKSAGQEAAAILAADFSEEALRRGVSERALERASALARSISVVREALALADIATSMHDPTEGGVACGLAEIAYASGVSIVADPGRIFVSDEVRELCEAFGIDPLETLSSGVLLATVPPERASEAGERLGRLGVPYSVIGRVVPRGGFLAKIGERVYDRPYVEDRLFSLFA